MQKKSAGSKSAARGVFLDVYWLGEFAGEDGPIVPEALTTLSRLSTSAAVETVFSES